MSHKQKHQIFNISVPEVTIKKMIDYEDSQTNNEGLAITKRERLKKKVEYCY